MLLIACLTLLVQGGAGLEDALEETGFKNVGIYFGSWNEWSRDPSLPLEEGLPYPPGRLADVTRSRKVLRPAQWL